MDRETTPLSSAEQQSLDRLFASVEQGLAKQAIDSWQILPRPDPLAEFDATTQTRADGKRYIPPGHVAFKGDFE